MKHLVASTVPLVFLLLAVATASAAAADMAGAAEAAEHAAKRRQLPRLRGPTPPGVDCTYQLGILADALDLFFECMRE